MTVDSIIKKYVLQREVFHELFKNRIIFHSFFCLKSIEMICYNRALSFFERKNICKGSFFILWSFLVSFSFFHTYVLFYFCVTGTDFAVAKLLFIDYLARFKHFLKTWFVFFFLFPSTTWYRKRYSWYIFFCHRHMVLKMPFFRFILCFKVSFCGVSLEMKLLHFFSISEF
jgi:hypothetical protein